MNSAQKAILFIGCLIIAFMAVYPPWLYVEPDEAPQPMGYSFIWKPPSQEREAHLNVFGLKIETDLEPLTANKIDVAKLLTQCAAVVAVSAGAALLLRRRPRSA
jgi:hypothetical protein